MPDLTEIFAGIRQFLESYGYWSVGVVVFCESFGLPVPGETLLISTSLVAARGELNIVVVAGIGFAAATLGDNLGYAIGRRFGRRAVVRYGPRVGLTERRLAKVESFVRRRGPPFVTIARFIEVARQLNGLAAGTTGMAWRRFVVFNALGAALWVGAWASAAYILGDNIGAVAAWARNLGLLLVGATLVALAGAFVWHRRRKGRP